MKPTPEDHERIRKLAEEDCRALNAGRDNPPAKWEIVFFMLVILSLIGAVIFGVAYLLGAFQ